MNYNYSEILQQTSKDFTLGPAVTIKLKLKDTKK